MMIFFIISTSGLSLSSTIGLIPVSVRAAATAKLLKVRIIVCPFWFCRCQTTCAPEGRLYGRIGDGSQHPHEERRVR